MNKFILPTFILLLGFLLLAKITVAAGLKYDPTAVTVSTGATFNIDVIIDAGTSEITSTDAYVIFDGSALEAQTVTAGSYFPTVTNYITSGKVYIAGMVDDPATSKTGAGKLATITFRALKQATVNLTYDCTNSKIVLNDINATNIIECSENGTALVTVSGGGTANQTAGTDYGDYTNTGANSDINQVSSLPKSGGFDNLLVLAISGGVMAAIGSALTVFFAIKKFIR